MELKCKSLNIVLKNVHLEYSNYVIVKTLIISREDITKVSNNCNVYIQKTKSETVLPTTINNLTSPLKTHYPPNH